MKRVFVGLICFFCGILASPAMDPDYIELQKRITDVYDNNKNAVVRVIGIRIFDDPDLKPQQNIGTGFFISHEGYVMTNATLTFNAQRVWVEHNGIHYAAESLGHDVHTNISILRLKSKKPDPISFVRIDENLNLPRPSTFLLAITRKLGLEPGPSWGMVSGHNREFSGVILPTTYIRSDIPSDGGEGGAPVFDLNGRFVGMILAAMPEIRNSFIAPASVALRIRDDILFSGEVSYGYIGVEIDENATKNLGKHLVISKALPNSPCAEAGVKPGDTLIHFNGTEINRLSDLNHAVFFARPGQCLTLTVLREGKEHKLPVHVTKKLPEEFDLNTKKSEEPAQQTTIASSKSN